MTTATVTAAPPLAAVERVSFAYRLPAGGRREVLRGVDLSLAPGELVALVGTNGSGKTTLLRVLAGILQPDDGSVSLVGRPMADWRRTEVARQVAVLHQHYAMPAGFRVAELVEMGRAPHATRLFSSTADDARAVRAALIDADARELAERLADELSGGERQRVLVAMALAQEPRLLLMDEPTLHLDLAHQVTLLSTIRRLQRQREMTVVAVLHDLNLALAYAPRVVILHDGVIAGDGAPDALLTPGRVREVFGVEVTEAHTAAGERHLALRRS
jgi:iron complex transport system ATP-binding protein